MSRVGLGYAEAKPNGSVMLADEYLIGVVFARVFCCLRKRWLKTPSRQGPGSHRGDTSRQVQSHFLSRQIYTRALAARDSPWWLWLVVGHGRIWIPSESSYSAENALNEFVCTPEELAKAFIRLTAHGTFPLDRLSRYEHMLWREARQLISTLYVPERRLYFRYPATYQYQFSCYALTAPERKRDRSRQELRELPIARYSLTKTVQMSCG
jgi:hypothetical protein